MLMCLGPLFLKDKLQATWLKEHPSLYIYALYEARNKSGASRSAPDFGQVSISQSSKQLRKGLALASPVSAGSSDSIQQPIVTGGLNISRLSPLHVF